MARSSNPVDLYRREQRKREVRKNKVSRVRARDAKVAATRTGAEVAEEMAALEARRTFQNGHLNSADTRALERLSKEGRIVAEAEAARAEAAAAAEEEARREAAEAAEARMATAEGVREANEGRYRHARMSVYYDPVMNPYGAPPPGRPEMYHAWGGGTTRDVRRACLPPGVAAAEDKGEDKGDNGGDGAKRGPGPVATAGQAGPPTAKRRKGGDDAPPCAPAIPPPPPKPPPEATVQIVCPPHLVGRIIGRGGATIGDVRRRTGCVVSVHKGLVDGDGEVQATITIKGGREGSDAARKLIIDIMNAPGPPPPPPPPRPPLQPPPYTGFGQGGQGSRAPPLPRGAPPPAYAPRRPPPPPPPSSSSSSSSSAKDCIRPAPCPSGSVRIGPAAH